MVTINQSNGKLDSNEAFEARCEKRQVARVKNLGNTRYRCTSCGEHYKADWVAYNGLVCDVECEGQLVEVGQ